ncbi:hypothetical protein KIH39_04055 [Telmatocola sphagniphila]|uniref:Neutral/alkaline non-lysosomal ceramidase N-terminal domain-containing protein n=1 Tax=Telmatocola sphagniphila TaxID=1123043 RepID=A0A8E6EYW0_9BACT|nr:hypothetical protein [Telmatocola sphagniphila]QVL33098.1 hypothetical protein KIH39_04055 [Telmatocola sphagniphila]
MRLAIFVGLLFVGSIPAAEPTLKVGFQEVDVSPFVAPNKPVYMAGFGHDRKATEVHDPIMARIVVLHDGKSKVALVCVDVVGLFLPFVDSIREKLPEYAYVMVSSSHNHEGPDTLGLWGASPFQSGVDEAYMDLLRKKIVEGIQKAEAKLEKSTVKIGRVNLPDLLRDGRLPIVKHDELAVLEFRSSDTKKRLGLLVNWHCHPETLDSKNTKISSDFVGYAVEKLKKRWNCPVAYFTGTVGGLMTSLKVPLRDDQGTELQDGTFEKTEKYGTTLAQETDKALSRAEALELTPFQLQRRKILLPVDNPIYKAGWQLGVLKRPIYLWHENANEKEPKLASDAKNPLAIQTELGWLKLGELEIATVPGEIYPELVLGKIQDPVDPGADFPDAPKEVSIVELSKSKYRLLMGLANDEIGYIIPKRQWDEKPPFCYGLKKSQYGEINSLGPDTAPLLMKGYSELISGK